MKHLYGATLLAASLLGTCGEDKNEVSLAPVERQPFVLLDEVATYSVILADGYAPFTYVDGTVLGFRYDDTSIIVTSPTVAFPDGMQLLKANRLLCTGRLDGLLGGHVAVCELPYRYCPFSACFTMHGVDDTLSYDWVDDSGRVSITYGERTKALAKGDTFQIVEWVLDTGCLVKAGSSLLPCSQASGDTVLYYVDSVTHSITQTNKGLYDWDQIHYAVPAPEP